MANKSVITDISRTTTTYTTQNYQAGVYDHMAGDWSEHTQLRVQDVAFFSGAGYLTGTKTLRLQVRDPVTLAIRTFAARPSAACRPSSPNSLWAGSPTGERPLT
jgi:hypothetical protein